jgi:hypothetical protein
MVEWREELTTIPNLWLLLFSYSMIIFINATLYNFSCDFCIFILCRVFIVCVVLCTVFRLIVVLFCVMCVICVLCLIVVPLPPGENSFAVKINIYLHHFVLAFTSGRITRDFATKILCTASCLSLSNILRYSVTLLFWDLNFLLRNISFQISIMYVGPAKQKDHIW